MQPRLRLINHFLRCFSVRSNFHNVQKIRQLKQFTIRSKHEFFPSYIFFGLLGFVQVSCAEPVKSKAEEHKNAENQKTKLNANQLTTLLHQSDDYFKVGKFKESFSVLVNFSGSQNAEILWRLSRALYNMSKEKNVKKDEGNKMVLEAYEYIQEALSLDPNNFAVHKWVAILVDAKSQIEGIKARISTLPTFKKHLLKAMELNPNDATSIYMLGQYCYNIAEMPWIQRKVAAALFAKPPEATFEEALEYFSKAEEAEPNFYSLNLLMLGKTYLKLNRIKPARYWLKCASNYPVRTDEDESVRKEAEELLRKHPFTKINVKSEDEEEDEEKTSQ